MRGIAVSLRFPRGGTVLKTVPAAPGLKWFMTRRPNRLCGGLFENSGFRAACVKDRLISLPMNQIIGRKWQQ
jgi:hypothetical protein